MTYGQRLREFMDSQSPPLSVRALGRRLNPEHPEYGRRSLQRIIASGAEPHNETRKRIADALGIERGVIEGDDSGDAVAALMARVESALSALREQLREEQQKVRGSRVA